MSGARGVGVASAVAVALATIAWLSPAPERVTDRGVYEATANRGIVRDCTDLHCFRVLVAWTLGPLPGASDTKWKAYAVVANTAGALAVFPLARVFGLSSRAAAMAVVLSGFGFGALYTLHDPFTSDPLMYALGPLVTLLVLRGRVAAAGAIAAVGVLAKEFVAAALYVSAGAHAIAGDFRRAGRVLVAANAAFITWLVLQLTLIIGFNYGYGDNPSTQLLSGGYVRHWLELQSLRGAASAMLNEFGALYVLAPAGVWLASSSLRRHVVAAMPVALVFAYVQQPDRALWNFHFLVTPLAALVLDRAPAAIAWGTVALFVVVNLRVGAQLAWVPAARFALVASFALAAVAVAHAWRGRHSGVVLAA